MRDEDKRKKAREMRAAKKKAGVKLYASFSTSVATDGKKSRDEGRGKKFFFLKKRRNEERERHQSGGEKSHLNQSSPASHIQTPAAADVELQEKCQMASESSPPPPVFSSSFSPVSDSGVLFSFTSSSSFYFLIILHHHHPTGNGEKMRRRGCDALCTTDYTLHYEFMT